jgi:RHS repeat-associated protein
LKSPFHIVQNKFSPFGVTLTNRNFTSSSYRYGFNGQEKQTEITGNNSHYTAEFWMYDSRAGRRWNLDPKPNPSISSYATFANNPIWFSDPKGDTIVVDNKGTITRNDKTDNFVYTLQGGKMTKLGELGKTVNVNKIYKNLLKQNAKEADKIWSPWTFRDKVKSGGDWDYKSNEKTIYGLANKMANNGEIAQTQFEFEGDKMEAQDIGNHHYGVVGKAYGFIFSEKLLLVEAGSAQMNSGTSKPEWQNYLTATYEVELPSGLIVNRTTSVMLPPYGDDPRDQRWIKAGFKYFDNNQETLEGE